MRSFLPTIEMPMPNPMPEPEDFEMRDAGAPSDEDDDVYAFTAVNVTRTRAPRQLKPTVEDYEDIQDAKYQSNDKEFIDEEAEKQEYGITAEDPDGPLPAGDMHCDFIGLKLEAKLVLGQRDMRRRMPPTFGLMMVPTASLVPPFPTCLYST